MCPLQKSGKRFWKTGDILQFVVRVYAFGLSLKEKDFDVTNQFVYSLVASQAIVHGFKK